MGCTTRGRALIERSSVGICLTKVRQFVVLKEFGGEGAKFLITGAEILFMEGLWMMTKAFADVDRKEWTCFKMHSKQVTFHLSSGVFMHST